MPWGFVAGAAIGAAGSIIGSNKQAKGQEAAAGVQQHMFDTINQQEQPFIQGGYGANKSLQELMGLAPATGDNGTAAGTNLPGGYLTQTFNPTQDQLEKYPGYQFARDQGLSALRSSLGPSVGALSGPALKSLTAFGTGLASTYYGDYFNQFQTQQQNIFNRLSDIARLGQSAATNVGSAGTQLGIGAAQAGAAAAGSRAAGIVGATNSLGSSIPLAYLMNQNPSLNSAGSYGSQSDALINSQIGYPDAMSLGG